MSNEPSPSHSQLCSHPDLFVELCFFWNISIDDYWSSIDRKRNSFCDIDGPRWRLRFLKHYPGEYGTGSTSAVITVTVSSLNNFVGDITISTSTNPSTGLRVNCPSRVSLLENLTIQFSCGLSSGTPGTYNVTLTGVGSPGTSSHLSSTIVQVGDYVISTPKPSISFNSGASGAVIPVNLTSKSFDDSVRLSSSIIPANGLSITCPSSPVGLTSNNTFTTSCSLGSSAPGTYLATITGVSSLGSITHSFNVTLHVGDFSISASSPAAAQAGTSATSTITLASSSFNGSVSVRISPPTGLSCNPLTTSGQLAANATSSIPLSCSSSKAGTFNVPMTATGSPGTSSHAASATFTFVDFNMTSTPSVVPPLLPNAVGNSTITIRSLNGFTGTVDLVASISPASGFVCTLTPASVGVTPLPPGNSNSTLSCSGSAGLYTVTVTGTSGSLSHTTTVSYTVQDFTVAASPTSLRVNAGTPGNSTIAVTSLNGYSGTVFLTYAIAPGSGLTCNLTPDNVNLGTSSSSTLSCKGSAATYNVNVTGTSGSLSHSVLVTYTVQDFTVSANPTSATADAGARGNSTITVASLNGFTGTVGLTTTVSPANGLNCAFSQNTVSLGTSGTSRLSCSGSAGPYTVTVTGRSGSLSHSVTVSYTIQDFTVAAVSASLTIDAGVTGNSTITVRSLDGFTGTVNLALAISSNSGLNCNLSQPSVALGAAGNSTLACSGSAGTYIVTVTGTGRSLSRSTTVQFTVQDYTVTAGTTALIINTGVNGNSTITLASLDSFSGTVSITDTISPPTGLTCNLTQTSIVLGVSGTSVLSCRGSAGNYAVTVTGKSRQLSHSVTIAYTVQDFIVTASPSSVTVLAGAVGSSTINVTSVNGFTGTVALTNSTSPSSGLSCSFSATSISLGTSGTTTLSCRGIARTFTITVTGISDSLSRVATVTFTVTDYNFTANPTTLTLIAGSTSTSTISVSPINGFTGSVALATTPSSGLTATLDVSSITTSGSAQLTLGAAVGGNYTVTVTGRSGTLSHSVIISVIVSDFTVSASNTVSFNSGASNPQTGVTIGAINHLTGSITLLPSVS